MQLGWVVSNDPAKAQKFFSETLGLTLTSSSPEWGWYEFTGKEGGFTLGVGGSSDHNPIKAGQNAVISMNVDNVEQAVQVLKERGVNVVGDIMTVPGHVKIATFKDLDDNIFQLVECLS